MSVGRELHVPPERVMCPDEILTRRARLAICNRAVDATEARELMDMCGIGLGQVWNG